MENVAIETESKRIDALKRHNILDTPPDGTFDRITNLAATIFNVPIAIISLVDTDRIWFKSHYGLPISQIGKDPGLCASAVLSNDTYVVENAIEDPRTLANPLVAGDFGLRFYAAAPLQTDENYNLGTLCIIDKTPRKFSEKEKAILKQLSDIVMDEMQKRMGLRETVQHIKSLTTDINAHLNDTIKKVEALPNENNTSLVSYLDASKMFFTNIEEQVEYL